MDLRQCRSFVFDMDGTLTRAIHDFDAIRSSLGLPAGQPILESLAALPAAEAAPKWRELDRIELELAREAIASEDASKLLEALAKRGVRLGIVTRNSCENVQVTLRAAGLLGYFSADCISTRDNSKPKPDPEGLLRLLNLFGHPPSDAVMIGDYLFDLQCGRRAGARTVHYAADTMRSWPGVTDLRIESFGELLAQLD